MFKPSFQGRPYRRAVLGIALSARYAGYAVLDGFGLCRAEHVAPAGTWDLRYPLTLSHRLSELRVRILRAIRWHRPGTVVFGISPDDFERFGRVLVDLCRRHVPNVVVEDPNAGLRALGWTHKRAMRNAVDHLATHFLPDLRHELRRCSASRSVSDLNVWRYRSTAWQAGALALLELARRHPWSAVALVRERPVRTPLLDVIDSGVQRVEALPV